MTEIYPVLVVLLLLNIVVGMVRILRGPTAADRMLAAEMFATSAVVIVLLMAVVSDNLALVDVALIFALLAALASVTFVSRAWSAMAGGEPGRECKDDERGGMP
jgi:multicomponent Na+:H+ antiporter subunit F